MHIAQEESHDNLKHDGSDGDVIIFQIKKRLADSSTPRISPPAVSRLNCQFPLQSIVVSSFSMHKSHPWMEVQLRIRLGK